jgi:hypothetical protein
MLADYCRRRHHHGRLIGRLCDHHVFDCRHVGFAVGVERTRLVMDHPKDHLKGLARCWCANTALYHETQIGNWYTTCDALVGVARREPR